MKVQNHGHLQEEQVLWAVIDEKELAGDSQKHLLDCPACKKKVEQFRDELEQLGQKARQSVPPFMRAVKLPKEESATVSHNIGWLPFFGAAAMAGFAVFFYFMSMETMPPTNKLTTLQNEESLLEDKSRIREISDVVEVPFSGDMYEITGDFEIGFDEDLYAIIGDDGTAFDEDLYEIRADNGTGFDEDMYEITGDNGTGFDEDFLDFVVPDIQDDFQFEII